MIIDIGNFICFHDAGFDEVLSNGMMSVLFRNQNRNIARRGESRSTIAFDEDSSKFCRR